MEIIERSLVSNGTFLNDSNTVIAIQKKLRAYPGLVDYDRIHDLKTLLEQTAQQSNFLLQMGDCAERFSENSREVIYAKQKQILSFKKLIEHTLSMPVVPIGRIAGQYAKPRSSSTEIINGQSIYPYHGDIINSESPYKSRVPDPERMIKAYAAAKLVLSHLADCGEQIFTSHECYLLEYENSLIRTVNNIQYNLSAHLLWLGMRNISSQSHINHLSSIDNPVALKIGPNLHAASIIAAIQQINPTNKQGKIILVTRLGYDKVCTLLPKLIEIIKQQQLQVIWMSDPLHGNTHLDKYGKKYRLVTHAIDETIETCDILRSYCIQLGGIHLEASPRMDIQECVFSTKELVENRTYDSALDPRLSASQCTEYLEQVLPSIQANLGP